MNVHASNLDIERFRKIHAHVERGANEGERENARRLAEALAVKAGLSFDAAVAQMKAADQSSPAHHRSDSWSDIFSDDIAKNREKERQRREARRVQVLTRYRTIFDVFEPTEKERALRKAVSPFSTFTPFRNPAGAQQQYTATLDRAWGDVGLSSLSRRARKAIEAAYPMPETLARALDEVKAWENLRRDRQAFSDHGEWRHNMEVEGRICILEEMLRSSPASSWDDVEARFDWDTYQWSRQWMNPADHERDDDTFLVRLRADISKLRASPTTPIKSGQSDAAQTGHSTTSQRRAAIMSMLDSSPELSSREIARRVGVSPQTVASLRKRCAGGA